MSNIPKFSNIPRNGKVSMEIKIAELESVYKRNPITATKICSKCGKEYPATKDFFQVKSGASCGLNARCKVCISKHALSRSRRKYMALKNVKYSKFLRRFHHVRVRYGITPEQYGGMLDKQKGCCLICGDSLVYPDSKKNPHIDHCHTTGKIRGILCSHCNRMLGYARDTPDILREAAKYLEDSVE